MDAPLTRLAWLTDLLQPEGAQGGPVLLKLLGPKTSTGLRAMVEEASHGMTGDAARILSGCEIYAATATAPEEVLLRGPLPGTRQPEFGTRVADFVEGAWRAGPGARLFRTIHPDDRLLTELVGELERRDIHVRPPGAGGHTLPDHVAIVTEWDTLYGRSLARAFIAEVMGKRACEISEQAFACGIGLPGNVTFHSYLRGIDGQLPGESAAAPDSSKGLESEGNSNKGEKPSKAPAENAPTERTEGLNQGDYLRRLAAELGQLDIRLRRDEGKGIRAVGVLGTDLYDKLEVMTALRAVLPQAQFFTTDLDARLALPAEWPAAHNLIVGSSYGLTLHPGYQAEIPPFRDVYQTSMYAATLAATGWLKDLPGKMQSPRLFEIGRRGAHDLTVVPRDQACVASDPKYSVQPTRPDFRGWWTTHIIWNFWPAVAGGAMFFIWPLAFAFSRNRATIIRLVASVAPQTLAAMALFIGGASLLWECWGANDWAYAQKAAAAALLGYLAIHVAGMGTAQALRKQPPGGVLWVTSGYVLGFLATTVWRSGGQGADRLVIRGVAALSVVGLLAWAAAGAGLVLRRWVRRRARRTRRRLGPAGGRAAWNFHPPWGSCWWLWRRGARLAYPALACLTFVVPVLVLPRLPLARVIEKVAGEPVGVSPGLSFAVPAFASIILFAAAGVVLCLAALWVARGTGFKLHRLATKTPPFAIIVGGLVVTVIWLLYRVQRVSGEPFALFEGLSVWPTEALRLVACALCVQFLLKAYYDTRSNDCDIASKFGLSGASAWEREGAAPGAGRDRGWWGRFFRKVSLLSWDVAAAPRRARPGQQEAEGCEIDVEKLWREYHRSGSLGPRLWRFVPVAAAYFVTFFFVFRMSGGGSSPCRGKLCHNFDLFVTFVLMIPLYMTLTFFVVDGSLLNYRFITSLAARPTRWPAAAYTQCRGLGMPNDLIGDYLDIRLIAGRTKVVGELVYYPFLVLFLLVVSRNSFFANWDWPATLIVMFTLNAAGAVACAYGLRKSAEAARDKAIRNLREKAARSTWEGQTQSAAAIRLLVEEVEAEREGAFSILSQHPILAAIILPSGSVGAWVLIEYLGRTMH